jgi:2-oxoisovalerate dehydrogenase E1 component
MDKGIMTLDELEEMEGKTKQIIFDAADAAEAQPDADGKDWPDFIFHEPAYTEADNSEVAIPADAENVSLLDGINYALKQEFRSNPNTFLWGQDIGKGGVFNVVKGMPEEFTKNRVFNAQIAEDQIVGTANGFSRYRDDIRVVIEGAEFADYFWPAMEQYVELAHEYWRTNGQSIPNVTMRLASGGYIQGGLYHSQSIEAALVNIPGVRIVYPAFADDAIGLMRNSIRSKGPTMFMEPKFSYNFKPAFGPIPPDDFVIPFGKAKERRSGTDVTVIAWGNAVHMSNFAAEELAKEGVSVQIIDLRSLIPWDKETVFNAVRSTNRVVIAHEAAVTGGYGGEIAAEITKNCFADLDAPVNRVGSKDCHVGFAKAYETEIMLQIKDVKAAILETVNY